MSCSAKARLSSSTSSFNNLFRKRQRSTEGKVGREGVCNADDISARGPPEKRSINEMREKPPTEYVNIGSFRSMCIPLLLD
eukprot:6478261-Amphidinium_carterae.1